MKSTHRTIIPIISLLLLAPALLAGEAADTGKEVKKEKRVIMIPSGGKGNTPAPHMEFVQAAPRGERRIEFIREGTPEMETVTFLGVQTEPVDQTLTVQLGIAKGTGLVVQDVVADSPAAGTLQEHDILLKLNDQVLINMDQLSVLVRNMKAGDSVSLTYLRGGREAKASIKLGEHEVPKRTHFGFNLEMKPELNMKWHGLRGKPGETGGGEGDPDHLLWMMDLAKGGRSRAVVNAETDGENTVSVTVNTGNGKVAFNDDEGSLELTTKEGKKELVAKDNNGAVLFSGPINTPEERAGLAPELKARLEKIETMHEFQFHTDEDFQGGETKVIRMQRGAKLEQPKLPAGMRRLDT
ncbi:MAG: PDZ domain-containing protein [Cephaloticoccus sp.]|nr:PDZ domain-containing protein [Cephaloticoccus sp.]MCF7758967.1 PDZ domain-containing protein [Cephaloticoccus sp.]